MKPRLLGAVCASVITIVSNSADCALITKLSGQVVYDTGLDITWLADANYAQTSGYDDNGRMNYADAQLWAANLEFAGFVNWRLPTTSQPDPSCSFHNSSVDAGYNCSNSEMSHVYYVEMGGLADAPPPSTTTPFQNVQSARYWSETTVAPSDCPLMARRVCVSVFAVALMAADVALLHRLCASWGANAT